MQELILEEKKMRHCCFVLKVQPELSVCCCLATFACLQNIRDFRGATAGMSKLFSWGFGSENLKEPQATNTVHTKKLKNL